MARGAAQQAAQHVAATLVGGDDAVANHHGCGTHMVGDDAQRNVGFGIVFIGDARNLADVSHNALDGINLKKVVNALHDAGQALKSHTGVDVRVVKGGVIAVAVAVKLGEHKIPDFDIAVAIAAHAAGGGTAAVFFAAIKVQLRAGAAGAGADLPEVILFAHADDALGRHTDLVDPDVLGLVVILVDGHPEQLLGNLQFLGQKFPCPGGRLVLKIIAEREVAQHLKIGAVAGSLADILNVAGADAFLAGAYPAAGRLLFSLEPGLHGSHARVNQQERGVVLGDKGKACQPQMPLCLKKGEEHLPQFV
ncbi:hypothetical protein SDC9_63025 [bioreactor metagenome]|uniref:Uncharacterized protein n=1 Tax=bioreactor metagenome TaxID=1076179 RepID=A0A644XR90_9ZZZZ